MTIKPLFDKIVVKAVEAEAKTTSGLFLPNSAQEKPQMAIVVAVGPGGIIDGKEIKMQVKVGDKILYSKYSGSDFKIDEEEVTIIKQSDVLAVIED
ncbi:MAG: co-chaperone GroES [Clostridia bacterium]|nr:co-chaperone GroES [Clostridia bacterium]